MPVLLIVCQIGEVHLFAAVHGNFALVRGAKDFASVLPRLFSFDCYIDLVDSDGDVAGLLGLDQGSIRANVLIDTGWITLIE